MPEPTCANVSFSGGVSKLTTLTKSILRLVASRVPWVLWPDFSHATELKHGNDDKNMACDHADECCSWNPLQPMEEKEKGTTQLG